MTRSRTATTALFGPILALAATLALSPLTATAQSYPDKPVNYYLPFPAGGEADIAARVQQAGIVKFEDLGLCTYDDPTQFYSFRRATHLSEPDYGRHINAIALCA